jgi:hypothetical protein
LGLGQWDLFLVSAEEPELGEPNDAGTPDLPFECLVYFPGLIGLFVVEVGAASEQQTFSQLGLSQVSAIVDSEWMLTLTFLPVGLMLNWGKDLDRLVVDAYIKREWCIIVVCVLVVGYRSSAYSHQRRKAERRPSRIPERFL